MELSPDDVRNVLHALDSSGLDELHLELADLTLSVRREGATGWTAEQQVLRRPVVEGDAEPAALDVLTTWGVRCDAWVFSGDLSDDGSPAAGT